MDKYILKGHRVVKAKSLTEWAEWLETADRHVAKTYVGKLYVSTVFLGIDHAFGTGPPMIFETMIFTDDSWSGEFDYQTRCSTWKEAEAMHEKAVKFAELAKE